MLDYVKWFLEGSYCVCLIHPLPSYVKMQRERLKLGQTTDHVFHHEPNRQGKAWGNGSDPTLKVQEQLRLQDTVLPYIAIEFYDKTYWTTLYSRLSESWGEKDKNKILCLTQSPRMWCFVDIMTNWVRGKFSQILKKKMTSRSCFIQLICLSVIQQYI